MMNMFKPLLGEINQRLRNVFSIVQATDIQDDKITDSESDGVEPIRIQIYGLSAKPNEGKAVVFSDNGNIANSMGIVLGNKAVDNDQTILYAEGNVKIEAGSTNITVDSSGKVSIENNTGDLVKSLSNVVKALQGLIITSNPAGVVTITGSAPIATSPSGVMRTVIPELDVATIDSFVK